MSVAVVLGTTLGAFASTFGSPTYLAGSSVLVAFRDSKSALQSQQGVDYLQTQAYSYAAIVATPLVLQPVVDQLELDRKPQDLASVVSASVAENTSLVKIYAYGSDPEEASRLATSVAEQLVKTIDGADGSASSMLRGTTTGPAAVPTEPSNPPKLRQNLLAGALAGLLLGLGLALVRSRMSGENTTGATAVDSAIES